MDLAAGASRLIVAMEHTTRGGEAKIVPECAFPLTGRRCVKLIVTDIAVIDVLPNGDGLVLQEVAPGWTADDVQKLTAAPLQLAPDLKDVQLL